MIHTLFDGERRKLVKTAIEHGDVNLFRRKAPETGGSAGEAGPGVHWGCADNRVNAKMLVLSGSPIEADFNLRPFESVEICGFTFTYRGNASADRLQSAHLDFDIRNGRRIQTIHMPFFDDSFFEAPEISMVFQVAFSSRGDKPDTVSGTIRFWQTG